MARRLWVSGRVQGVSFRAHTQEQALRLGLRGHARNLPDGRVEVLVCGGAPAIEALASWLWTGSPGSRVDAVRGEVAEAGDCPDGFSIG